jgi:hypothetical protein
LLVVLEARSRTAGDPIHQRFSSDFRTTRGTFAENVFEKHGIASWGKAKRVSAALAAGTPQI